MPETVKQTAERPRPLIYRPPPRWYFWTALGTALAIHLTAVAISQRHEAPAVDLPPQPPQVVEAVLAPPEATPPPEDIPIPEPPPPPDVQPEFVEERTPPPRQPQNQQKFTPIKAPGPMSMSRAKALALYAPRPQYPYEARSRHVTGSGVIVAEVDSASGNVTSASVAQSTGSPILDSAATSAFRQWRFRPGTVSKVNIPITFTMTGASY
jgi:TonB family protein